MTIIAPHADHLAIVVNQQLPHLAKLPREKFIERVANLEAIRTRRVPVSLFLGEKSQMAQLEVLHAAVQTSTLPLGLPGFQIGAEWIPFVLELPQPLHQWLASHSLSEVKAQLVNWLAALHAAHCQRSQVWRKLLPEVRQWSSAHYTPYRAAQAEALIEVWEREFDNAQQLLGGVTPGVLVNPFRDNERPFLDSADVMASYQFVVRVGYFRKDDWLFIVERNRAKLRTYFKDNLESGRWTEASLDRQMQQIDSDTMDRAEADRDLWQCWRHYFIAGS